MQSKDKEINTFEDLYVYKLARQMKNKAYALIKKLPEEEKFNLIIQIKVLNSYIASQKRQKERNKTT